MPDGEVAEWSIAAVLKTVEPQGSVGSNPTLSATQIQKPLEWGFCICVKWKARVGFEGQAMDGLPRRARRGQDGRADARFPPSPPHAEGGMRSRGSGRPERGSRMRPARKKGRPDAPDRLTHPESGAPDEDRPAMLRR